MSEHVNQNIQVNQPILNLPNQDEMNVINAIVKNAVDSKYFDKIGGIPAAFSIAMYAREMGLPLMSSLFGGIRPVLGKVEIAPQMMNAMIRRAGHHLKTIEHTDQKCTIWGKRRDTNEEMTVSFSIEDAKRAGIYKGAWMTYPKNMVYKSCLSNLSKWLYPDVTGMSYVEGELDENFDDKRTKTIDSKVVAMDPEVPKLESKSSSPFVQSLVEMDTEKEKVEFISAQDAEKIESLICPDDKEGPESYRANLLKFFATKYKLAACEDFTAVPVKALKGIFKSIHSRNDFLVTQQTEQANG